MNKTTAYLATNALAFANLLGISRSSLKLSAVSIDPAFYRRRIQKGLRNFDWIRSSQPDIKTMLEFGTGAHGIDLMLAFLLGVEEIHTVDIDDHLACEWAQHASTFLEFRSQIESQRFRDVNIDERVEQLTDVKTSSDFFRAINGQHYRFDELQSRFQGKIGLWYSESNLQRIPLSKFDDLSEFVISKMTDDAIAFHRLDLKDIYTQPHWPLHIESLHRFDFLKYGPTIWSLINRDSYSSQNRLRFIHYVERFSGLGLHLQESQEYSEADDREYVQRLKLASPFKELSPEELAISHVRALFRKGEGEGRRASVDNCDSW